MFGKKALKEYPEADVQQNAIRRLLDDGSVQRFEDDRHKVVTFGAFDLFESLDVVVLGAVHDREDLGDEAGFAAGPLTGGTVISRFHRNLSLTLVDFVTHKKYRLSRIKL